MRQFFVFLSIFLLLLLAFDRAVSRVLNRAYAAMRGGQNGGQLNAYLAQPRPPEILIMGNSRVYHNISPDSFRRPAANLAHNGTGQVFHTGVLHVLRQAPQKLPAALVLHIDLDEYAQPPKPEEITRLNFYYGRNPYVTAQMNALSWSERVKNVSALYRHNGRVFSLAKAWLRPVTSDFGYKPIAPSQRDSLNTLYSGQRRLAQPRLLNRAPLRALREFVAVCKAAGVPLVCFSSPYYQRPPYLAETSALVDSLLRAEHVAYLNYGLHPVAELQRSTRYWRDDTHLNARGVPLQSQALAQQVAALLPGSPNKRAHATTAPGRQKNQRLIAVK